MYETVVRFSVQVPSSIPMWGDDFEETHQVPKEFSCGRQNSLRDILPCWRALYTVKKPLLGLELSDKADLSVSKLWQSVSQFTLWSLNIYWYFVWSVGHSVPWPVASTAQYLDPCAALWFLFTDICLFWFESIRFARLRFTLRFRVQWNIKFCLVFGLKPLP